jgi:hypothetical protein
MGRLRVLVASVAIAAMCSAFAASEAAAAERVQDGTFDGVTCGMTSCPAGAWFSDTAAAGPGFGPLAPRCGVPVTVCSGLGGGFHTAPNWARFGAGSGGTGPEPSLVTTSLSQNVTIPPGPATLSFLLHMPVQTSVFRAFLTVKLDGTTVFFADETSQPSYSAYQPVTIDVTAFSGGTRALKFEGTTITVNDAPGFDVDTISLQDTPASAQPAAQPPATPTTGQRAAALAKCKKKRGKARRNCKKRANKLPL